MRSWHKNKIRVIGNTNKEDLMVKIVSRLLILALFVTVPAKFLHSEQVNPANDKSTDKKESVGEKTEPGEESSEKATIKKTEGKDITLKEIVVKG